MKKLLTPLFVMCLVIPFSSQCMDKDKFNPFVILPEKALKMGEEESDNLVAMNQNKAKKKQEGTDAQKSIMELILEVLLKQDNKSDNVTGMNQDLMSVKPEDLKIEDITDKK